MRSCTKRIEFDAGHRLLKHESKCRNVHGHRYVAEITCFAPDLDDVGRVADFGEIKRVAGGWIDKQLDHAYIGEAGDDVLTLARTLKLKVHEVHFAPTVENLAEYLFAVLRSELRQLGVELSKVRLYETPNGWSEYP